MSVRLRRGKRSLSMKRLLIVSPHFPPLNAPDHHRVRTSLPHFREFGWDPTVLAVDAARVKGTQEPLLAASLPKDVAIHRVGAWPEPLTRLIGLGNLGYRAWFQLQATGNRLLQSGQFDLVYFSTTQFVATALGPKWHRRFAVPYVVDLQDPWRTDYYERPGAPPPPGGWKYRFARRQAERLEELSWRDAAGFVSVSQNYLDQLNARYAWFSGKPTAVIPFGAAEADVEVARVRPDLTPAFKREPGVTHVVSVGAVGAIMRDSLRCFFSALRDFRTADSALGNRFRFHFIGTSYAAPGRAAASVKPVAAEFGLSDLVDEVPERVGYFSALKTMLAADGLLIPTSDDVAYNPSKIATCFMAKKPTLAFALPGSALERAVSELDFATLVRLNDRSASLIVGSFLRQVRENPEALIASRAVQVFARNHTAHARTQQQCALFERALAAAKSHSPLPSVR